MARLETMVNGDLVSVKVNTPELHLLHAGLVSNAIVLDAAGKVTPGHYFDLCRRLEHALGALPDCRKMKLREAIQHRAHVEANCLQRERQQRGK